MVDIKIGDLGKRTGCQVETIRYYENEGLLAKPSRSNGNYRLYSEDHVERLQFIRHCRSLDMTLSEIRALLRFRDAPDENCGEVTILLDEHIGHVTSRIGELRSLQRQLRSLRGLCLKSQAAAQCGILQGLSTREPKQLKVRATHGRSGHSL